MKTNFLTLLLADIYRPVRHHSSGNIPDCSKLSPNSPHSTLCPQALSVPQALIGISFSLLRLQGRKESLDWLFVFFLRNKTVHLLGSVLARPQTKGMEKRGEERSGGRERVGILFTRMAYNQWGLPSPTCWRSRKPNSCSLHTASAVPIWCWRGFLESQPLVCVGI